VVVSRERRIALFKKYQHIERLGSYEVQDILEGMCHVFYKIDGTNASVWLENGEIKAGSRNRELSLDNDNAGFCEFVSVSEKIKSFFELYPNVILYGEWLVPHTLKTYKNDAWREFYVFDVMSEDYYLPYDVYKPMLELFSINYIPPIAICSNPTIETLYNLLEKSGQFLVEDGKGLGEGIVIKNYKFKNKHGRTTWAKIITSEFKEKHVKSMGEPIVESKELVEVKIVEEFVTEHFINKEINKLFGENGFDSKKIQMMLNVIFNELVKEETYNFVRKYKNPTINFKTLFSLTVSKIKRVKPELF
jgi:hypothetical protein